jgi:rhodanese-related sulfurtransferase
VGEKQEPLEISPREAKARLTGEEPAALIDVREPWEHTTAHITGSRLLPMSYVGADLQTLEGLSDQGDLLILCHHGVRSLQVAAWLRERGIGNAFSVAGGIDRWSQEVDPEIPRY